MMIKVLVAEDEPLILNSIAKLIHSLDSDFIVCAKAKNGLEVLQCLNSQSINIIFTDIKMPLLNGLDLIQEIRVPTETVTEITESGKRKEVERKIFPGYVIVKMVMTDESWYAVRNIRGCTGFVGPSSKPIPLTEDEVARLGIEKKEIQVSYQVGDSVNIVDGPLEGFVGTVEELDVDKNRVRVTVSMFGRETPVELELDQAEPVN